MLSGNFMTNFITFVPPDVAGGAHSPWVQLSDVGLQPIQLPEVGLQTGGFTLPAQIVRMTPSSSTHPFTSPTTTTPPTNHTTPHDVEDHPRKHIDHRVYCTTDTV